MSLSFRGCQGNLTYEIALSDFDRNTQVSSSCVSPMTVACVDEPPVVDICEANAVSEDTAVTSTTDLPMDKDSICTE